MSTVTNFMMCDSCVIFVENHNLLLTYLIWFRLVSRRLTGMFIYSPFGIDGTHFTRGMTFPLSWKFFFCVELKEDNRVLEMISGGAVSHFFLSGGLTINYFWISGLVDDLT